MVKLNEDFFEIMSLVDLLSINQLQHLYGKKTNYLLTIKQIIAENNNKGFKSTTFFSKKWMSRGYVYLIVDGKRYLEHRYVWEKHNGEIPAGFQIHHINEVKHDNRIENLQIMSLTDHLRHHKDKKSTDEELLSLRECGLSYKEIGGLVGLKYNSVIKRLNNMCGDSVGEF